jgi:hypothetical protein
MLEEPPPREEMKREEVNGNKGVMPKDSSAMTNAIKVMAGLLLLVGLTLAGLFTLGSMQQQQQATQDKADQALQKQQQANEDLQKQLENMQAKQDAQEKADLQKQIDQLKAEQQDQQDQQAQQQPQVVVENNENITAPPSQAGQGEVVVTPGFNPNALNADEQSALDSAVAYYQAAEVGDYQTTWSLLSFEDQANYPISDWIAANQALDTGAAEFVVTDVYPDYDNLMWVDVDIYLPDGSVVHRTTEFALEDGMFRHWLTAEEMAMFDEALGR